MVRSAITPNCIRRTLSEVHLSRPNPPHRAKLPYVYLETALNAIDRPKRVSVCDSERYKTAGCVAEAYNTFSETDKEGMRSTWLGFDIKGDLAY